MCTGMCTVYGTTTNGLVTFIVCIICIHYRLVPHGNVRTVLYQITLGSSARDRQRTVHWPASKSVTARTPALVLDKTKYLRKFQLF